MKPLPQPPPGALLRGLASVYRLWMVLRNRRYDRPGHSHRAGLPVLSVGNITAGGTGKTPTVAWIVERLLGEGRRPAVVSRGYGGTAGRGPLVVSTGAGPLCSAERCGDEPWLLARTLERAIVVVGSDRRRDVDRAKNLGAEIIVLDDGFQHRRLARDLDIVLLDAEHPFGNGYLLPAGTLREPVEGLARADLVLVTRTDPQESVAGIEQTVREHNPLAPVLRAGHVPVGFLDDSGRSVPMPARVVAFCGIGNPDSFRAGLASQGCEVLDFRPFRDHHRFTGAELRELQGVAGSLDAALVTTEKDLARLGGRSPFADGTPFLVLRVSLEVYDPGPLLDAIENALAQAEPTGFRKTHEPA